MSIEFNTPAEAFMAVAVVTLSADGMGTIAERQHLFEHVKGLPVFQGSSADEFNTLCNEITDKVYASLPTADMGLAAEGIDQLISAVNAVLNADQRKAALGMATDISHSDGSGGSEQDLLSRLEQGLAA